MRSPTFAIRRGSADAATVTVMASRTTGIPMYPLWIITHPPISLMLLVNDRDGPSGGLNNWILAEFQPCGNFLTFRAFGKPAPAKP